MSNISVNDLYCAVRITEAAQQLADRYAIETMRAVRGDNYTALERDNRFVSGMLGQLAFARYLAEMGVRFEWRIKPTGKSEEPPFVLYMDGQPLTCAVRTAASCQYKFYMVPVAKVHERIHTVGDVEVATRLRIARNLVELWGWVRKEDMRLLDVDNRQKAPAYTQPLDETRVLLELVDGLDKGDYIVDGPGWAKSLWH